MTETLNPWEMGDQFDPRTISWVLDHERLGLLIAAISTASEVVTDLETTGLDEHATGLSPNWPAAARVSMASFTLPQESNPLDPRPPTYVLPLSHPEGPWAGQWVRIYRGLLEALRSSGKPITNQNLKFDMRWMTARTGVDLSAQFAWDTQIGSHLLNENASTRLKDRAPDTFGVPPWDDHDLSTPAASEKVPLMELGEYAARDTYWTWRLAVLQRTIMAVGAEGEDADPPEGPEEVEAYRLGQLAVWCAMPQARTLTEVEQRGLLMDEVWVKAHIAEYEEIRDSEWQWLTRRYADDLGEHDHEGDHDCRRCRLETEPSFAPTSLWFQAWADLAVERGDLRVAELTPGGRPKWSKSVLTRHARNGKEVAEHLLAYRKAVKRLEFLNSWMDCQTPEHTVHTTYNVGRVVTGRLSSNSPNVQQIEYALKQGFVPRPGYLIADLDYCLEGSMRILTSDLRWIPADQIEVGQKIIGFPETVGLGAGHHHSYEEAEVTSVKTLTRPSVIVLLSDGRQVRCSREHRWMTYPVGGRGPRAWTEAGNLVPGQIIPTLTEPWDEPNPVDAAYMRGFLDGEGWVTDTTVGWGQLPGPVRDEVVSCAKRLGIEMRQSNHLNNGVEQHIVTTMSESLRILGMVRPHRLLPKARQVWEGRRTYGKHQTGVQVVAVLDAGEQNVVAVGTSTRTMVVEGLLSHNSQIELRVAAHVAQCEPMIEAYRQGRDLHRMLASDTSGVPEAEVTADQRQRGKAGNFGFLYGMSAAGFMTYALDSYDVGFTAEEAEEIRSTFFTTWDGLAQWHQRVINIARRDGQITSPIGRVRRVPHIWDGNDYMASEAERQAINSPVQGFASDLMQMAAASIHGNLPGFTRVPDVHIVGTVHDSIVVEVPEDDWQRATARCMRRMLDLDPALKRLGCSLSVPLSVEAHVGSRWGLADVGVVK